MIVSPIPGMTPDRASEHTLQGTISNLNAYAEGWTGIVTAGTNVDLTPAQVLAKNIRLDAGASGAFTLTFPPTARIIDALGPTLPLDGSFWFPLYVYNNGTGQSATLTAGDGDTVIDPSSPAIADADVVKWMVNVEAAAPGPLTNPRTLNFHFEFAACCGTPQEGCPPDLEPIVLQFGTSSGDQNKVLQYSIASPGTAFARVVDAADLGTGSTTYAPFANDRSAIWNAHDDKMYFLATKTTTPFPPSGVLVQFDPRTLTISGEMELPVGWDTSNSTLVDVADERAWIQSGFDATFRCFDTVSFTEMFTDGGALATLTGGNTNSGIACNSGQILLNDATDGLVVHLITVTSPTTFTDTAITVPGTPATNIPIFANNGSYRRRWIMDRNKVVLCYEGIAGAPTISHVFLDLNDLSSQDAQATNTWLNSGVFWDPYQQRIVGSLKSNDFGTFISDDTGGILGVAALNNGDWSSSPVQTLGGLAWVQSLTFLGYGGFNEDVPAFTPDTTYETTSFISTGGNQWDQGKECISLRRKDCLPITAPQRGGAEWVSPVFRSYVPFAEGSSGQTITNTPASLQYFNSVDTAGWFDVAVGNPGGVLFTPKIRGYYAVEAGISAKGNTGSSVMFFQVTSPTTPGACETLTAFNEFQYVGANISDIVHCDGDTETISITCQAGVGMTWDPGVSSPFDPNGCCYFNVWLLKKD